MDRRTRAARGRTPVPGTQTAGGPGRRRIPLFLSLAVLAVAAGCDSFVSGSDWSVRIGTLATVEASASIEVPASAAAGEPFTALVRTMGGGCDRAAGTRVERGFARTVVVPHDSIYVGDGACPAVLTVFEHRAELKFREPGEKTVRFRVRGPATGALTEVDRTVEVVDAADPGNVDDR